MNKQIGQTTFNSRYELEQAILKLPELYGYEYHNLIRSAIVERYTINIDQDIIIIVDYKKENNKYTIKKIYEKVSRLLYETY